nr:MAG TPA: squamosa promoter-binding protein-like 12-binding domain, STRUCTURAL GENOMICS, RIKEN [Caudoviricetes sp.]
MKNKVTIKLIYSISHLTRFCQSCQAHVRVL